MKNKAITTVGLLSALSIIIFYLSLITSFGLITSNVIASVLISMVVILYGRKYACIMFFVVSVLGFLMTFASTIIFYGFFFGWYPIIKDEIERKFKTNWVKWGLKFVCFNAAFLLFIAVILKTAMYPNIKISIPVFVLAQFAFVAYDICFTYLLSIVYNRIIKHIK